MRMIIGLLAVLVGTSASAGVYSRLSDTRTSPSDTVAQDRKDWALDLSLGTTFDRGNVDQTSGYADALLFKGFGDWSAYLSGDLLYVAFGDQRFQNKRSATARVDYRLNPGWRIFAFDTNAYNEFLKLDYRTTAGIGPWFDFSTGSVVHGISLAPTFEYEKFRDNAGSSRTTRASLRYIVNAPVSETATTGLDFFYVPVIDDFGDAQLFLNVFIEASIFQKVLGLKLAFQDEYDSKPQPGVTFNDSELVTTLVLHLGK